jgi:hypothetical protein
MYLPDAIIRYTFSGFFRRVHTPRKKTKLRGAGNTSEASDLTRDSNSLAGSSHYRRAAPDSASYTLVHCPEYHSSKRHSDC